MLFRHAAQADTPVWGLMRTIAAPLVSLCIQFSFPALVLAQCGSGWLSLKDQMNRPPVTIVFRGSVIESQRRVSFLIMTFKVDRVWKGSVSRQVTLYQPIPRPGGPLRECRLSS